MCTVAGGENGLNERAVGSRATQGLPRRTGSTGGCEQSLLSLILRNASRSIPRSGVVRYWACVS